ncbi:hypothetical protein HW115_05675 [Verrucomicrobiaceae bacterium N1E253]|uniref:Uncharacterized protein n=1 Tax=Oceaniferula marina TaxID=2748318 RepID=A0A851GD33_9BACT|nr:hypothetical protein [Oceaniferula marina]NWK55089.1 hypothetical protein [Oceaniferula marina]
MKDYSLSLEEAEASLNDYLRENNKKYVYHPCQVIAAFDGGYLFVQGDFKLNIQLRGYFVDAEGVVFIDTGDAISVEKYHKKIGREGWP